MKEIVCAHRWSEEFKYLKYDQMNVPHDAWWKECKWCRMVHYSDRPVPRVVIAHIEEKETP